MSFCSLKKWENNKVRKIKLGKQSNVVVVAYLRQVINTQNYAPAYICAGLYAPGVQPKFYFEIENPKISGGLKIGKSKLRKDDFRP